MMSKKISTTLLFVFLFLSLAFAQKGSRHKEIIKKRIEYLKPKLDLTVGQSQVFWPLYNEYQEKKSALSKTIIEKFGDYKKDIPHTEEEYRKAVNGIMENKVKQNELMTQYYTQYLEVIGPEKVYYLYQYEDQFNKLLLRKLKESSRGKDKNHP